jgi:type II secretory pathway pseudopilin PulG
MVGPRRAGYSLIEITIAMAILVTVLLSAMSFIGTSMTVQRTSTEMAQARSALERRASAFRALLHSNPLDAANKEAQFQQVLDTLCATGLVVVPGSATLTTEGTTNNGGTGTDLLPAPKTYDLDLVAGGPKLNGGPNQAQIRVWAFTRGSQAETICGLEALNEMDLDGDATTVTTANTPVADLFLLPLKLEIEWVDAVADATRPTRTMTLIAVLY